MLLLPILNLIIIYESILTFSSVHFNLFYPFRPADNCTDSVHTEVFW